MAFVAEHAVRSHSFVVALPAGRAFRLFEPEGERAWAEGWEPHYVYPADGHAETGMVFTTEHSGEHTIWMLMRHDPQCGLVEYARVTPGSRVASVLVQCAALDASRTRVTVIYRFTALSEAGNALVRHMDETRYRDYIESWRSAIEGTLARQ
jgi:hypothetical protein